MTGLDVLENRVINTADDARELAKDWQTIQSEVPISYSELADWQEYFTDLATTWGLTSEFEENGII